MSAALESDGLTKRYGRRTALSECTLSIPDGRVVGLVGPNGAGKSTLLQLVVGLLRPTEGRIRVLGRPPAVDASQLARVGFVAQDAPVLSSLTVADHVRMGARLNAHWDDDLARRRVERLRLDPQQPAGRLSGGERAQLALTLAIAKRPELLVLDEPVASLDPLARHEFLQSLMEIVAEQSVSVVMSSHLVSDLERICDHLVLLTASRVQLSGDVERLLGSHHRLVGPRRSNDRFPGDWEVIQASHADRQTSLLVRTDSPILDPAWVVSPVGIEDLVLAYMKRGQDDARSDEPLRAWRSA